MNYDLILANVSKFITLTDEERDYFISILKHKSFRKKQYLLNAGDVCKYEYFVIKGCLRCYYLDDNGTEHILYFAVEDWWAGDMGSFISQAPAMLNIDAIEDSEVLMISKPDLDLLFDTYPKFDRFYRELIQKAFVSLQRRVLSHTSLSAEQRYINLRTSYPYLEQRLSQVQIASFLGITPEFLSKIRKQLATK